MFFLIFVAVVSSLCQKDHLKTLRNYGLTLMITAYFRPLLFCITHLPDANPLCSTNQYPFTSFCPISFTPTSGWVPSPNVDLLHAIKNTFDILLHRLPNETCGDMIFSGHTRYVISSLCVISSYLSRYPLKYVLPCYLVALCLALFAMYSFIQVGMWNCRDE